MKISIFKKPINQWAGTFIMGAILFLAACGPNTTDNETDYVNEIEAAENAIDPPPGEKMSQDVEEDTVNDTTAKQEKVGGYEREEAMGTPTDTTYNPDEPAVESQTNEIP